MLTQIKSKVLEYEKCCAGFDDGADRRKIAHWLKALRRNKIIFQAGGTAVHYASFKRIDFTGPEIDNQEWRAQLNRFFWLEPIAWEYARKHDRRWAQMARDTIEVWLEFRKFDGHENPKDVWQTTGDNTLSASIRLGQFNRNGWWGAVPHLNDSGLFDAAFVQRMLDSTAAQLRFIKDNVALAGNWRISQLDTMFFLGYCLPGMAAYLDYAVANLNEAFYTQVDPDGSHVEHTPGYHDWMRNVFTKYAYLQKNQPRIGLDIDPVKLARMWEYSLHLHAPDHQLCGLNDSLRWQEHADPVVVRQAYEQFNRRRVSYLHDFGLAALPEFSAADWPSRYFPCAGHFFIRHGRDQAATMFIFDAGVWGSMHCHRARNAVNLYHNGKMLLIDPGALNYEPKDPFSAYGRSTPAHNTVALEGMTQTTVNPIVEEYYEDDTICLIHASFCGGYENEATSIAGEHRRTFLWVKDCGAVVYDHVWCMGGAGRFSSRWQTLPGAVVADHDGFEAHTDFPDANVLVKAFYCNADMAQNVYCGSWQPPAGWVAAPGGVLAGGMPAPMICYESCGADFGKYRRFEIGQVLMPYNGRVPPSVQARTVDYRACKELEIKRGSKTILIVSNLFKRNALSMSCQIGPAGNVGCDGKTAVLIFDANACVYAYGHQCTYLTWEGRDVIRAPKHGDHVVHQKN